MLLSFFESCEASAVGTAIRESIWLFPVIETVHLLALAVIGGAVILVDLRLLGQGLRDVPVAQLARQAHPWFLGSLAAIVVSGVLLFLSEAMKCYANPAFWTKMAFLAAAVAFACTLRHPRALASLGPDAGVRPRVLAAVSLVLWSGVGLGGRFIGFY
jgi:hypothetical protein